MVLRNIILYRIASAHYTTCILMYHDTYNLVAPALGTVM